MLNLENLISKTLLKNLYLDQKLSDMEIGNMYNVSLGKIHRLRTKYGIKTLEQYQRHHKHNLNQEEKEILTGTLLGDGHLRLRKGHKSYPQLMLEQSINHKEYIFWLHDKIKDWLFDPSKPIHQSRKVKNGKIYHLYSINTICHPVFFEFHKGFYNKNKKIIDIEFIEQYLTSISLAIWLMDDGTKSKNRNIALCTQSFNKFENEKLIQLLKKKFDLTANLWKSYEDKYLLGFSKNSSIELSKMLDDIVIPSMKYKLISSETTKGSDNNPKV